MKAILAIDSFKGCLTTFQAEAAVREALLSCGLAPSDIVCLPVSDGGEGFEDVVSHYGTPERVAYIESAKYCGYTMVDRHNLDPFKVSSFPLGFAMRGAYCCGYNDIVVGLGGTCTIDAGVGVLQGLRADVILEDDNYLPLDAPAFMQPIAKIDTSDILPIKIEVWADSMVTLSNAVWMYGPQKGLTADKMPEAQAWMRRVAELYNLDINLQGSGAAGGIGAALAAVYGAQIFSGADKVLEMANLQSHLESMVASGDQVLLITGEGKFDAQTLTGKLPSKVASIGAYFGTNVKCICLAGSVDPEVAADQTLFDTVLQITPSGTPLDDALRPEVATQNLKSALTRAILP